MTLQTCIGALEIEALLDPGSQLNLLSPRVAKEMDLRIEPLPNLLVTGASGTGLSVYGTTVANVTITDSRGRVQVHEIPFVVAELARYGMYLGLPWFDEHDPKLNIVQRRLLFRGTLDRDERRFQQVAVEDAEEFERTLRSPSTDVFAVTVGFEAQSAPTGATLSKVPTEYSDFADLGSDRDAKALPRHGPQDLAINIVEGADPPHKPLYNLSASELAVLRKYLADFMSRGWIRRSKSPAGAPILFAKKKDGTLRLCVDYRGLNKITIKNRCPLPLIAESLERLAQAKIYTKLDVREAYHRIRIKEGDEWKTAFRTRYGHFEYTVMPFGLTNAPAQFQAYINQALAGLVDVSCIVYLDDILIFSNNKEDHIRHVREVLARLREFALFVKMEKCDWHTDHTEYLGYIISPAGVSIDPERVKTIQKWPMPATVRDVRVFIGFMNYYRRFIANFSKLALALTKLTQKTPNSARGGPAQRREESQPLQIGPEARESFRLLKNAFLEVPILTHYNPERETRVEVDASGGAIAGILSQLAPNEGKKPLWRPVDFYSRKLIDAEYRYDTHDQELLAITKSLEHWRHYLEGRPFEVLTDHHNLKWFMETKVLNHRQVRSYLTLSKYNFVLNHRPGSTNPADGPSRRPDYMAETKAPALKNNEAYIKPMRELFSRKEFATVPLVAAVTTRSNIFRDKRTLTAEEARKQSTLDHLDLEEAGEIEETDISTDSDDSDTETVQIAPKQGKRPQQTTIQLNTQEEKADALQECHSNPMAGHFGARRTLEKLSRKYAWKGMAKDVADYCHDCLRCKRSTPAKHKPYGLLQPLPIPTKPWEDVTMDFITELPPSKFNGIVYDAILVVVCRLTKMSHYVPARGDWDGSELAQAWIREVIRLHGAPRRIISDRGPLMSAKHWKTFNYYLNSRRILTSAYHPQTDGQTERQNQTLEQYLRCYCSLEQDDWALWISTAEYAYNDSLHATIKTTPFRAYIGSDPIGTIWPDMAPEGSNSHEGKNLAEKLKVVQESCREEILKANNYSRAYANKKRLPAPFEIGDKVLLSTKHIKSMRPKKKLDWKYLGPGVIQERIGAAAYKVNMPGLRDAHPVFHASLLEPYNLRSSIPSKETAIEDTLHTMGEDVYEVDHIVERRRNDCNNWEYRIRWKNFTEDADTWEPSTNISAYLLKTFLHKENGPLRGPNGPTRAKLRQRGRRLPERKG